MDCQSATKVSLRRVKHSNLLSVLTDASMGNKSSAIHFWMPSFLFVRTFLFVRDKFCAMSVTSWPTFQRISLINSFISDQGCCPFTYEVFWEVERRMHWFCHLWWFLCTSDRVTHNYHTYFTTPYLCWFWLSFNVGSHAWGKTIFKCIATMRSHCYRTRECPHFATKFNASSLWRNNSQNLLLR